MDHPTLGAITVAVPKAGFTTMAGGAKIVSAAFVSCEKSTRKIAIELANSLETDTRGGLLPLEPPRLVCSMRAEGTTVRAGIVVRWVTNELGDGLARGLAPGDLKRCDSIEVLQNVALPAGSAARGQRLTMAFAPADAGVSDVFAACSDAPFVNAAARPAVASAKPTPADVASPWKPARTLSSGGRTNVRASPDIKGALVTQLYPGTPLLVQKAEGDWWRVKPTRGNAFAGFVRADRLAFP